MSKIHKELETATEIKPSTRLNETITDQAYLKRLVLGVQDLAEAAWDALPRPTQDWYNTAIDAIEKNENIPGFPDMEAASVTTRRRGASEPAAAVEMVSTDAKKHDKVSVTTKRGVVHVGEVVEADAQGLVLDVDGKDVELDHDKIDKIAMQAGHGKLDSGAVIADPEVGDTVQVLTKRGKTILGNITEMTETELVLKDVAGEVHELAKDRLESVVVKSKNVGRQPAAVASRAGVASTAPDKTARTTPAINGGVSITTRIREIVADNLNAKKDQVAEVLKKEGLEFKQATLDLTFGDMHKIIGILRDRKIIK